MPCVMLWAGHRVVAHRASGRVYADPSAVPACPAALVLGCARRLGNGRANLYFKHRIEAVIDLWTAGRIDHVLVSGDNSRSDYDEPGEMKAALMAAGVPAGRIHCDYAGFRTLDSVVRAHDVFQLERMIIVSQRFHIERALYIADHAGIDAWGYAARDVTGIGGLRTTVREYGARVKALLDVHILLTAPRFGGPVIPIVPSS